LRKSGLNTFTDFKHLKLSRRQLLSLGLGTLSTLAVARYGWLVPKERKIEGEILGAPHKVGHRLREGGFPPPSETRTMGCVIVGGGISGLSAAWRLQKKGARDFVLLELDQEVGGNSRSGSNSVSAYPWGAHYVPIPNEKSVWVRELFEDLGVIEGYDKQGLPIYNEFYLCSDPQERLLIHGRWQEGLIPHQGISPSDKKQIEDFLRAMEAFRQTKGNDGKRAFEIPLESSSRDPRYLAFDQISMADYLAQQGWDSPYLRWYVNYCCRDDFGTELNQVSAWAGIHYFAGRAGFASNAAPQSVITWPEGNGWLVARLKERLAEKIRSGHIVFDVRTLANGRVQVDSFEVATGKTIRWDAASVIFAAPRFVAAHVIESYRAQAAEFLREFSYAPWMVANVTLDHPPQGPGVPLSWDNVPYEGDSLGYVVATHQKVSRYPVTQTVLTYYLPLSAQDPVTSRKAALARTHEEWAHGVARDLERMHPGIQAGISRIDVWIWGHGMIQPKPGFIWGKAREEACQRLGNIHFAHSDLSGFSIFEEAQFWGVRAADEVMRRGLA
jgi:protoporphyrinogen oxidase